jgi:hypothetical protein
MLKLINQFLFNLVPLLKDYVVARKKFTHLDFIWAEDTGPSINEKVIKDLAKYA